MIASLRSTSFERNPQFVKKKRSGAAERSSNLRWLDDVLPGDGQVRLLLLGGRAPLDFRLRVAQSHVRDDMTPSHWSHVCFLGRRRRRLEDTEILEISLEPPKGFGFAPSQNAVRIGRLERYRRAKDWPNVALIHVPVDSGAIEWTALQMSVSRPVVDAVDLVLRWLAFAWGAGDARNPLLEGFGLPAAVFVETVLATAGFEITPGVPSRGSCPEIIWQAARWWHTYYDAMAGEGASAGARTPAAPAALSGAWVVGHSLVDPPPRLGER